MNSSNEVDQNKGERAWKQILFTLMTVDKFIVQVVKRACTIVVIRYKQIVVQSHAPDSGKIAIGETTALLVTFHLSILGISLRLIHRNNKMHTLRHDDTAIIFILYNEKPANTRNMLHANGSSSSMLRVFAGFSL